MLLGNLVSLFVFHLDFLFRLHVQDNFMVELYSWRTWVEREFQNVLIDKGFPDSAMLRICLPMQGTQVRALVPEDTT